MVLPDALLDVARPLPGNLDMFLEFAEAGADSFIVHWEGSLNLHRTIQSIRALGKRVAVAINPATPASALEEVIPEIDQVLVMTVDPGFVAARFDGGGARR